VAQRTLYDPPFKRLNDWMDSPACVVNHSQAHVCRRALKLHQKLIDEGKDPLPGITFYRLATEGAPEKEWVGRAEAIRGMSTRKAHEHLKEEKPGGENELALAALLRVLNACGQIEPEKALAGLAASEERVAIVVRVGRGAKVLLDLYEAAKEAPFAGEE
jgi:hypothetical protein